MEVLLGGVLAAVVAALAALLAQAWGHEHQTRAALRQAYAELLVAQRQSREASLQLARAGVARNQELGEKAVAAHARFIDSYHKLNLDSTRSMWLEARALRNVLGEMLKLAQKGRIDECEDLVKIARDARQNLERTFRKRLRHRPLQKRRNLGDFDKKENRLRPDEAPKESAAVFSEHDAG